MRERIQDKNWRTFVTHQSRRGWLAIAITVWFALLLSPSLLAQLPDRFDPNANNVVRDILVQPDGKILISGNFTSLSPNGGAPVARNYIGRLNLDGTLDTAFNPNANDVVSAIAIQTDGKILVGGNFTGIGGQARNRIARLDPTTGLADSFNPNANSFVYSIALQSDGKILAGGFFTSIGGSVHNYIVRLDPATGLADSFNPSANNGIVSMLVQPDDKIVLSGLFSGVNSIGGTERNFMARLDPSTGLADSFNPNANSLAWTFALQADGKVLAGGPFTTVSGQVRSHIARLDPETGLADSFDPNANGNVNSIVVQADSSLLVGGDFGSGDGTSSIGGAPRNNIARLDSGTGLADSFDPSPNGSVSSIAVQADGNVVVVGWFTSLMRGGGAMTMRNRVARLLSAGINSTPTPTPPPAPTPTSTAPAFIPVGPMNWTVRFGHTATRLENGRVLILGGVSQFLAVNAAELYDPITRTFTSLWPVTMTAPRADHTATLLPTGDVLITGGTGNGSYVDTAELFETIPGQFKPLPSMASVRWGHTATLLRNGKVLIAGGRDSSSAGATAELFDPVTNSFIPIPPMTSRRYEHSATLLPDGRVLIAGGSTWNGSVDVITNTAEIFDPVASSFTSLSPNNMTRARDNHTATLLPNGKVLIAGGYNGSVTTNAAELFDPSAGAFVGLPNAMTSLRSSHTATLLTNGEVLIAGGYNGSANSNLAELFRPQFGAFVALPPMNSGRSGHEATLLDSGSVLLTGTTQSPYIEELFYPGGITISGTVFYCLNSNGEPIRNVTLALSDNALGTTVSNISGNYTFTGLVGGGNYSVTPSKIALAPSSSGIDTIDVIATQRHYLRLGIPLAGCPLAAADVNGDSVINTVDVIATQRFFLGRSTGIANVGKYQFAPAIRTYSVIANDQANQNYDALVLGDVVSPFVE